MKIEYQITEPFFDQSTNTHRNKGRFVTRDDAGNIVDTYPEQQYSSPAKLGLPHPSDSDFSQLMLKEYGDVLSTYITKGGPIAIGMELFDLISKAYDWQVKSASAMR